MRNKFLVACYLPSHFLKDMQLLYARHAWTLQSLVVRVAG
jgi:hypothetical protein